VAADSDIVLDLCQYGMGDFWDWQNGQTKE
jgi:hypothetical protein